MPIKQQDFIAGLDLTDRTTISPQELVQLISNAKPNIDRGMVLLTLDVGSAPEVPNANANPKYKRYIWLRQQTASLVAYVWNENAATDTTFLKWLPITVASVADGSISVNKIADNAVTDSKIKSVSFDKLFNVPTFIVMEDFCTGDLEGSKFKSMSVKNGAITDTKLATDAADDSKRAVGSNAIKSKAIDLTKLALAGIGKQIIRAKAIATEGWEYATNHFVNLDGIGTSHQSVRVNAAGDALVWTDPSIYQQIFIQDATATSGNGVIAFATQPQNTDGNPYTQLDVSITPKVATSKLLIEVLVNIAGTTSANRKLAVALFQDAIAGAIAVGATGWVDASDFTSQIVIKYMMPSTNTALKSFKVRYGSHSGTCYINRSGTAANYGSVLYSSIKITEIA